MADGLTEVTIRSSHVGVNLDESLHAAGLSATIAAESGATEAELNAMFGWSGHRMAQLYTRKADRKRLAARAMQKWTRPSSDEVVGASQVAYLQLEKEQR